MPSVSYKVPTFNSFSSFLSSSAAETSGDETWTFAGPTYTLKLTGNFNEMNKTGPITGFEITKGGDVIVNTFAFLSPFSLDLETFRTELGKSAGMGAAYLLSGDETINGTAGEDNLQGFEGADFLYGGKDSDQIFGGGGNDFINAGEGDDFINAGDGDDRIVFNGNDAGTNEIIYGGNGKDTVRFDGSVSTPLFTMDSVEQLQFGAAAKVELSQFFNNGVNDMVITGSAGVNTLALTISLVDMFGDPVSRSLDFTAYTFESWGAEDEFTVTGSELADMIRGPQVKAVLDGGAGDDALIAGLGADRLVGGAGADTLVGGRGDDTYVVDGADDVFESAGGGVDTILTAASFSLSSLVQIENLALADAAGTTASKLTGNALANAITADAGANVLAGGAGKDKLTGGLGKDTFVFNTAPNKSTNVDLVTDFKRVDDTFHLDNKYFKTIGKDGKLLKDAFVVGKKAVDAEDRVIYDKGTGNLFYDADGTGKAAAIKIAVLQNKTSLSLSDFIVI